MAFYILITFLCVNMKLIGNIIMQIVLLVIFACMNKNYIIEVLHFFKEKWKRVRKN